jgi:hypothetical protein
MNRINNDFIRKRNNYYWILFTFFLDIFFLLFYIYIILLEFKDQIKGICCKRNNINNNNNQNKDINPYDLNQPNIPNINYPNLNNGNPKNNSGNRYAHDIKKIRDIIDRCELLYKQAQTKYENYEIKKAINNLTNAVKGLDGLKQSITNNKTEFNSFLPRISSMRIKIFNDLHKYRLTIYQLIPRKFQPVKFYDTNFQEFIKRYILTEPFISFEVIYDPNPDTNKKIKTMIIDYYQKS